MKKFLIVIFIMYISLFPIIVESHDNNIVHPFTITGKAINLLSPIFNPTPEQLKYKEMQEYFYDEMPSGYREDKDGDGEYEYDYTKIGKKDGTFGSIAEDTENEYLPTRFFEEIPFWSMLNHFYFYPKRTALFLATNPSRYRDAQDNLYKTYNGGIPYRNTMDYSIMEGLRFTDPDIYEEYKNREDSSFPSDISNLWNSSVSLYQKGDEISKRHAYFQLGRILHLMQDMTCPPHIFDDVHLTKNFWFVPKGYPDTYEDWEDEYFIINKNEPPEAEEIISIDKIKKVEKNDYRDYMEEMMDLTYRAVRIKGKLVEIEPVGEDTKQPESELKKAFPGVRFYDDVLVLRGLIPKVKEKKAGMR